MKVYRNNRLYSTDTAKLLAHWTSNHSTNDLARHEENLYQKRTGEYFLHGSGGPGSPYAERVYGSLTRGEDIVPLTFEQAREWGEKHLPPDEYERIFSIPDEGGDTVQLALEISQRTRAQLDRLRAETGKTMTQIIADAIEREAQ